MEGLHIGKSINLIVKKKGITISEFARRINKSRENVYSIFKRKTIDTGLLQIISKVLEYDFFKSYTSNTTRLNEELTRLKQENKLLKEMNILLRKKNVKSSSNN